MYIYSELGLRVSEGADASRKYVLELRKSPEFQSEHGEVQRGVESPYIHAPLHRRMNFSIGGTSSKHRLLLPMKY
jgi:hypothetical protein